MQNTAFRRLKALLTEAEVRAAAGSEVQPLPIREAFCHWLSEQKVESSDSLHERLCGMEC